MHHCFPGPLSPQPAFDDLNVNAAMVRPTSAAPFLDQMDHARSQAAAETENHQRLASFGEPEAELSLRTYLAALNRRPEDWLISFNLALFCQELKRDAQAAEQFDYLVHRFPQVKDFRLGLAMSLLNTGNRSPAVAGRCPAANGAAFRHRR
jgi:hypothetical protein